MASEYKPPKPVMNNVITSEMETFSGTLMVRALPADADYTPDAESITAPGVRWELLPPGSDAIIPGSLLLQWGAELYSDRDGVLFKNIDSRTNAGVAVGTVDYTAGTASLATWPSNQGAPQRLACLTSKTGFSTTRLFFRTPGAPLRPASLQITAVRADTGQVVTATADLNGVIASGVIHGRADWNTGIVELAFTSNPADETGASDVPMIASLIRYNAVLQTSLPLDAGLLGLDPVRLPADGRVPIYREGDVLVIHHTAETLVASPAAGGSLDLERQQLADVEVLDGTGLVLRADAWSVDREAGVVSWANPLVLQDEEGNPLGLPLIVRDRVEHMAMCNEVQITGAIGISSPMPWDLPQGETQVSSAVAWGDMQARVHNWFTQQTWSQGAPNWTDAPQGNTTTAQYNSLSFPPVITNGGAIDGRWALVFTSSTAFNVVEEKLGVISTGNTSSDCSPLNALTGKPYFTIRKEGWGSGWAASNAVRFNTDSALGPMWVIRTVISGQGTVDDDQFKLQIRGDAD